MKKEINILNEIASGIKGKQPWSIGYPSEQKKFKQNNFRSYISFEDKKECTTGIEYIDGDIETKLGLFTRIALHSQKDNVLFVSTTIHFDYGDNPGHYGSLWQKIGKRFDDIAKQYEYGKGKVYNKYTGKVIGKSTSKDINEEIIEMIHQVQEKGHWVIFNEKFSDDYIGRFAVFLGPFETSIGTIEYLKFAFEEQEGEIMTKLFIGFSTKKLYSLLSNDVIKNLQEIVL